MAECENTFIDEHLKLADSPRIIPISQFIGLSIFSFSLYQYYWFYRNWKDIKNNFSEYKDISPILRTLGLFIPFINIYLEYKQFNIIQEKSICFEKKHYKMNSILIILLCGGISCLHHLPKPYNLLTILNSLPLIFVQSELNKLWRTRTNYEPQFYELRSPETIFLILGLLVWAATIHFYLK